MTKPRKQEVGQEKISGAKAKGVGAKKLKGFNTPKPESKKDRGETVKGQEQSQVSHSQTLPHQDSSSLYVQFNFNLFVLSHQMLS